MPDYQRLFDYDGNCASWETLLRRSGLRRPPKKSCTHCYGKGFRRVNRSILVCGCVDKPSPEHRKGNKDDKTKIDVLAFRMREEYLALMRQAKNQNVDSL